MRFRHPTNGYMERGGSPFSPLWCFLFGPLWLLYRGAWKHALLETLLIPVTMGTIWFLYPVFARYIIDRLYLRAGWFPV